MRCALSSVLIWLSACNSVPSRRPIAAMLFEGNSGESPISVLFDDGQAFQSSRACRVQRETVERVARMGAASEFLALPLIHKDPSCCDPDAITVVTPSARRTVISSDFHSDGAGARVPAAFAVVYGELKELCADGTPWQPSTLEVRFHPISYPCRPGCDWPTKLGRVGRAPIRLSIEEAAEISADCASFCSEGQAYVARTRPVWPGEELWRR